MSSLISPIDVQPWPSAALQSNSDFVVVPPETLTHPIKLNGKMNAHNIFITFIIIPSGLLA